MPTGCAIAIIMDGNGRWASRQGLPVTEGHRAGGKALRRTVEAALDLEIGELTVYAFSTENWRRSPAEVAGIMQLFGEMLDTEVPDLHLQGVRMRFLGRRQEISPELQQRMEWAEQMTGDNTRMTLAIAFNYGGRAEVIDAARTVVEQGGVEALDEGSVSRHLYLSDMREPDMIIRTAGEQRVSNFMLWQGAYSELHFTDTLWPDFGIGDLQVALDDLDGRERRYGGRSDAVAGGDAR